MSTSGLRLQGCPRAGEAIAGGGRGRAVTSTPEAPLRAHVTLGKVAWCEEVGGSLSYGSSHHNEIQAPLKSMAKVTDFSHKDFCLRQCIE